MNYKVYFLNFKVFIKNIILSLFSQKWNIQIKVNYSFILILTNFNKKLT
jgi:hypothetical protein